MPKESQKNCIVCTEHAAKYTCAACYSPYCSLTCYKQHKLVCSGVSTASSSAQPIQSAPASSTPQSTPDVLSTAEEEEIKPLRPLTSLRWPYVPEPPSFEDPLTRNDPKPLNLPQFEAIATSAAIRQAILSNPRMPSLLRSLDSMRPHDRDAQMQHYLGLGDVDTSKLTDEEIEDIKSFKALAEAIENTVRPPSADARGLDWDDAS